MKKTLLGLALGLVLFATPAFAQNANVAPLQTAARYAYVVEADTGTVLFEKEADVQMPTSSMSKVMTMYLVFEALQTGKLKLDQLITISETAWRQEGSRMFVNVGQQVSVEDLIRGVIIQSGNDASVALAEAVAGTEASFAELMNDKAKQLGMANSHFMNATGLPDPQHYSTCHDLATLAQALIRDFPQYYHYYNEKEFTYNNIKQGNRNPLLYRFTGADGMKTGHTEIAGYGLIGTAMRENRRVLTVLNGMKTMQERADESVAALEWAYREYGTYDVVKAGVSVGEAKIWLSDKKAVPLVPAKALKVTLPRGVKDQVKIEKTVNAETQAPVQKGQQLGSVVVSIPGRDLIEVPLVAAEEAPLQGLFARSIAKIKRMLGKE